MQKTDKELNKYSLINIEINGVEDLVKKYITIVSICNDYKYAKKEEEKIWHEFDKLLAGDKYTAYVLLFSAYDDGRIKNLDLGAKMLYMAAE